MIKVFITAARKLRYNGLQEKKKHVSFIPGQNVTFVIILKMNLSI